MSQKSEIPVIDRKETKSFGRDGKLSVRASGDGTVWSVDKDGAWKAVAQSTAAKEPAYPARDYVGQMKSGSEQVREGSIKSQWVSVLTGQNNDGENMYRWEQEFGGSAPTIGFKIPDNKFQPKEVLRSHSEALNKGFLLNFVSQQIAMRSTGGINLRWNGYRLYNMDNTIFRSSIRNASEVLKKFTKDWPTDIGFDGVLYIPYDGATQLKYLLEIYTNLISYHNNMGAINASITGVSSTSRAATALAGATTSATPTPTSTDMMKRLFATLSKYDTIETPTNIYSGNEDFDKVHERLFRNIVMLYRYFKMVGYNDTEYINNQQTPWSRAQANGYTAEEYQIVTDYVQQAIRLQQAALMSALTDTKSPLHIKAWEVAKFQVVDTWTVPSGTLFHKRYEKLRRRIMPLTSKAVVVTDRAPIAGLKLNTIEQPNGPSLVKLMEDTELPRSGKIMSAVDATGKVVPFTAYDEFFPSAEFTTFGVTIKEVPVAGGKSTTLELMPCEYITSIEQAQSYIKAAARHQAALIISPNMPRDDTSTKPMQYSKDEILDIHDVDKLGSDYQKRIFSGPLLGFKSDKNARLSHFRVQGEDSEIMVFVPNGTITRGQRSKPREYFPMHPQGTTIIYYRVCEDKKGDVDDDKEPIFDGDQRKYTLESIEVL